LRPYDITLGLLQAM